MPLDQLIYRRRRRRVKWWLLRHCIILDEAMILSRDPDQGRPHAQYTPVKINIAPQRCRRSPIRRQQKRRTSNKSCRTRPDHPQEPGTIERAPHQGGLKRGPGRPFLRASRSTIRRTPSKSRNHARARYSDPPGDLETDTSPHSPGLSRRRGIAKPPAESSGPARRTRPTREIEGACQAESLADHSLASASHRSSELEHSEMRQHPLSSTTGHGESTSPASSTCSGVTDSADPSVIALRQPSAFGVDSRPSELSRGVQEPHLPASRQLSASIRA